MSAIFLSTLILLVPYVLAVFPVTKTQWVWTLMSGIMLCFGLSYLILPTLTWNNPGLLFLIVIEVFIVRFLVSLLRSDHIMAQSRHDGYVSLGLAGTLSSVTVFMLLDSTSMMNAKDLAGVLDVRETTEVFDPKSVLMDTEQARFVDQDLALRASKERLGEQVGLGAMTQIADTHVQSVNGELSWVSPLAHSGLFKYLSNVQTPGYITVSVSRFSDTEANLEQPMAIGTSGFYFNGDLNRYLYMNGYHATFLEDYTLELDDTGKPYWVVSKYERTVGMSGKRATGVLIIDAHSKEIRDIDLADLPKEAPWVDRVQSESTVLQQITNWGKLSGGFINGYFVGKDVINPTEGLSLVYTKDGRSMWYTGLQSGASQEGTVGFMMVDTKTGEATMYRRTGITEEVAQRAIEGKVQEYGYKASKPIPYNVNGFSTFVAVLKDAKGNPQMIGMTAYNDRSMLAVGENLETAMRRYQLAMSQSGESLSLGKDRVEVTLSGRLDRVGFQQVDGHASLHFTLKDDEKRRVFTVSGSDSARYILSRPGDWVDVTWVDTGTDPIIVTKFENAALMP